MSYGHESIPDANFEYGSSSSFGDDLTKVPLEEGIESSNLAFYLRKTGITFKK